MFLEVFGYSLSTFRYIIVVVVYPLPVLVNQVYLSLYLPVFLYTFLLVKVCFNSIR